jgi:hypothetical protein
MNITQASFILFMLACGALVVAQNWRATIPLLLIADLLRIGVLRASTSFGGAAGATLVIVELVAALGVAGILLLTALTFGRDYGSENLDEFGLMELRAAARRAHQQRSQIARWSGTIVPLGAVLLAALATWLIVLAYPIARAPLLDAAWIFALLCGLLALITANDVLKLGLGLLLITSSAKLLYFSLVTQVDVVQIALLEAVSLTLALVAAYLSGLLFGRLRTLEFGSLFERR